MDTATPQFIILNQLLVYLLTSDTEKIGNIMTQIRALKGVVTLSVTQATTPYSQTEHITKLRLKFLASAKNAQLDLKQMKQSIANINGVTNVILKLRRSSQHREGTGQQGPEQQNQTQQR